MAIRNKINVLGLSLSHCATACLLQDGKVVGAVSEERFNRKKNSLGLPKKSIEFLLKQAGLRPGQIDLVVSHSQTPLVIESERSYALKFALYNRIAYFLYHWRFLKLVHDPLYKIYRSLAVKKAQEKLTEKLVKGFRFNENTVTFIDHYLSHAYAPWYGLLTSKQREEKFLVFTNDGMGDRYCATVNIFKKNHLSQVGKKTPNNSSLALVYTAITKLLGMKTLEHEYKVMGLAPYADKEGQEKSYNILKRLIWLKKDLSFQSKIDTPSYYFWLKDRLEGQRFDWIAGAIQKITVELLVRWVKTAIEKTGIKNIVCGGGIFMNVKINMLITKLPEIKKAIFMPSATDESTAIGAAFWGYRRLCQERDLPFRPQPLKNCYLGPSFSQIEIRLALKKKHCFEKYRIEKTKEIEKITAKLLAKGKIVARFAGRMEWGARALGNRSILANPSKPEVVRIINEQIKNRDFWMPFAATILSERQHDYIINPKNIPAPYMILAFETTERAKKELAAAIHPYDFTCRPQILEKEQNPSYYEIIKGFERLTGIGAVLNTSLNLHGDPIVCSPEDAIYTFENSGLQYVALENYLVSKQ